MSTSDSPSAAPRTPSSAGGSIEPAAGGDAEADLQAIQAEVDELFGCRGDYDPGTFAVLAWCAGFALTCALERAWRARGIAEPEIDGLMLSLQRRRGARPDA